MSEPCPHCRGTGQITVNLDGSGDCPDPEENVDCYECHGTGKVPDGYT